MWSSIRALQGLCFCVIVSSTPFYYGTYRSYGTGDTVIQVSQANGGPRTPYRKWQVECLDGEAVTGISDFVFDFGGITNVWCKFLFPYKPAIKEVYPFYPNCFVRNYTKEFFCYDPLDHVKSSNSFITGFWDSDGSFWVYRAGADDNQPYKCCKTPPGYYIDYVSCYYMLTHDQFWEYYDAQFFLLQCATGYVMTGISKKFSPLYAFPQEGQKPEYRIEWIQCCRLGFGAAQAHKPPVISTPNGGPVAYSSALPALTDHVPSAYQSQYRIKRYAEHSAILTKKHSIIAYEESLEDDDEFVFRPSFDTGYNNSQIMTQQNEIFDAQKPTINDISPVKSM